MSPISQHPGGFLKCTVSPQSPFALPMKMWKKLTSHVVCLEDKQLTW